MSRTIIDSHVGSPRLIDVPAQLDLGPGNFLWQNPPNEFLGESHCFVMPVFEGFVAEPHGLLDWRGLLQELVQLCKVGLENHEFVDLLSSTDGLTLHRLN